MLFHVPVCYNSDRLWEALALCKYEGRNGDLFFLSWDMVQYYPLVSYASDVEGDAFVLICLCSFSDDRRVYVFVLFEKCILFLLSDEHFSIF